MLQIFVWNIYSLKFAVILYHAYCEQLYGIFIIDLQRALKVTITLVKTQMQLRNMSTPVSMILMMSHSVSFSRKADLHVKTRKMTANQEIAMLLTYYVADPRGQPVIKKNFILINVCYLVYICTNVVYAVMEQTNSVLRKALCTGDGFLILIQRDIFQFALSWILLLFPMNRECQAIVCCAPK